MQKTNVTTERVLYNTITPGIQNVDANVKYYKTLITAALKEFDKISNIPLTLTELQGIVNNQYSQAQMVADILTSRLLAGKSFNMDGIKISASKLANIIEIPECVDFLQAISAFKKLAPSNSSIYRVEGIFWEWYKVEDNKVSVDETLLEAFKDDRFREFATTPEQIARLNNVLPVVRALNELVRNEPAFDKYDAEITNVIVLDHSNDQFIPHSWFVIHNSAIDAHVPWCPQVKAKETPLNFSNIHD